MQSGRFGKLDNDLSETVVPNGNGYYKGSNGYGNHNQKADDTNMMEVILKNPGNENKPTNGHHGSNSNIPAAAGGLPGIRGRTRQSISGGELFYKLKTFKKRKKISNPKNLNKYLLNSLKINFLNS